MTIKEHLLKFNNIFFYYVLEKKLADCKTVLEVGFGHS